jgi:hypothetical protein
MLRRTVLKLGVGGMLATLLLVLGILASTGVAAASSAPSIRPVAPHRAHLSAVVLRSDRQSVTVRITGDGFRAVPRQGAFVMLTAKERNSYLWITPQRVMVNRYGSFSRIVTINCRDHHCMIAISAWSMHGQASTYVYRR